MGSPLKQVVNVLVREGEYWTVVFGGRVARLRDAKGLHYLDYLVRHPGEEFHALALIAAVDPPDHAGRRPSPVDDALAKGGPGDAGPVIDAKAVAAYRQRVRDLQEDLADAEASADEGRLQRAQDELDALTEQLAAGLGLGGRYRRSGSASERARLAVTKAIRATLRKLEQADPELGRHLDRTVKTGTFCAYAPDPAFDVVWRHDGGEAGPAGTGGGALRPQEAAIAAHATPTRHHPGRTSFVGRPFERGLVNELVAAAAAGRGGLLLVSGEAGIGKTRLVEEALAQAELRAMGAFVGRCLEAENALAWLPLVQVLEQLVRPMGDAELLDLLGPAAAELAKLLPSLHRRFPDLPPPLELPAEQARHFLFATLRDLILRLGAARPAVLALEDIHWADPATLSMLEHLADGLENGRVLVIATYRSDEAGLGTPLARTLERLLRHPACATLALGPFDTSEVAELVGAVSGRVPPPSVSARLWAQADGNPFFVEELVKHLAGEGLLYGDDGQFRPDLADRPLSVPDGLRLLLGHRLRRLSASCRDVVNLVAVIGRDAEADLLSAIGTTDEHDVMGAVEEALAAGVLVASRVAGDDGVGFSHALMREAALADVSVLRRRRLHLLVAEALRRRHGEDPEHVSEIADHLERAGPGADRDTTVRFLELAARRSLVSTAYEDAAAGFQRALALVPADDAVGKARLLAGLGYAQRGLGRTEEANAGWTAALELLEADPDGDRALTAELCRGLGRYLDATGGLDEAIGVLQRGLMAVGRGSTAERSRLLSALGYALALHGDQARAAASVDEAEAVAEDLDDDGLRADVLASRTCLDFAAGSLRGCINTADAAERALSAQGQEWDAVQAQVTTAWPRLWLGRVADARRHVDDLLPRAERLGHRAAVFLVRRGAALIDFVVTGDGGRFAAQADEGVEFCRENRLRWLADAHVFAGLARFWRGDWEEAEEHLRAATVAPVPPIYAGRYSATLLTFLAWTGDGEGFDRLLGELRSTFERMGVQHTLGTTAVTLAEVEGQALLGRYQAAAALYPAVAQLLDAGLVLRPPDLRIVEALAGLAASLCGDASAAEVHFEAARRLVATLPHPRQAPEVDFLHAVALLGAETQDDRKRAKSLLTRAISGYQAFGMPRHQALAEAALVRPGQRRVNLAPAPQE